MKVGIIHEAKRYALDGAECNRFAIYNFSISTDQLSLFRIFYSAFGTPARYVMELFRRLYLLGDGERADSCFLFNPFIAVTPGTIERTLAHLVELGADDAPIVVSDKGGFPIGYYLPARTGRCEERYLSLLSTVNSWLDQSLLNLCFFADGAVSIIDDSVRADRGNGFLVNEDLTFIYQWTARTAVSLLERVFWVQRLKASFPGAGLLGETQLRDLRDSVKFTSIMPHHAGDVLFYALAANNTAASHIGSIVVNRRYANILEDVSPGYAMQSINPPPPLREGNIATDEQGFMGFAHELPPFSFYYYCRQVRNYNVSEFHLIDHFGFALGQSFLTNSDLITKTKPDPPVFRPSIPLKPYRVLLHFDAGWGLKVYPKTYQKVLIRCLLAKGIEITILGIEDRDFGAYQSITFKGLEQFKALLTSHHLLVGSDSFPSHYAAHVQGLPTICLFGPTKPANSDARVSDRYLYLENGMNCRPCIYSKICAPQNKSSCDNFVLPDRLWSEIQSMLAANYEQGSIPRKV